MAYNNRGNAKRAADDQAGALADYDLAIGTDPGLALAYFNRGITRLFQGREAEAERDFEQCLKLDASLKLEVEDLIKRAKQQIGVKK